MQLDIEMVIENMGTLSDDEVERLFHAVDQEIDYRDEQ